eukprot:10225885-Ditylum_brightwellii.AAC.2
MMLPYGGVKDLRYRDIPREAVKLLCCKTLNQGKKFLGRGEQGLVDIGLSKERVSATKHLGTIYYYVFGSKIWPRSSCVDA